MTRPRGFGRLLAFMAAVATLMTALLVVRTAVPAALAPSESPGPVPYACDEVPTGEMVDLALEAVEAEPGGLVARMLGAAGATTVTEPGWLDELRALLAEALAEPFEGHTAWSHIALQNAAYRLAARLSFELDEFEPLPESAGPWSVGGMDDPARHAAVRAVHARALEVVDRWALPPLVFASMVDRPHPVVERWLGPPEAWVERRASFCGNTILLHEAQHSGALAFRPIRSGSVRALVALMTAFDTAGRPHVTPLVHRVELRFGLETSSPACVLDLDATALDAAGTPALARVGFGDLPATMFIRRAGDDAVGCHGRHSAGSRFNAVDVTDPAEIAELRTARRDLFLAYAAERMAEVRAAR